ncbi:MAG: 4Fe-4S dicluster domain-containing protein [Eubacteriales bacterium]
MKSVNLTTTHDENIENLKEIVYESGVEAKKCYQCGKCTAGCPVAFAMDKTPRQIMRMLQLSMVDDALKSKTIWLCAGCQTCTVRCPKEVDIAKVMETLRIIAKKKGYVSEKIMDVFHDTFLKSIERNGRVYEVGLILGRNIFAMKPLQDAQHGLPMLMKGKLAILPHKIKDNGEVKKIFENVRKRGGEV